MRNAQAFGRCCLIAARLVLAALCLWAGSAATFAQDVLPVPPLSGRVIDQTGTLTAAQNSALSAKLATLEQNQGSQVVVLVVATTQPEDITAYAQRVGDQWKIGRRELGDGLLIVVAKNDRKVRIEVAKTLEGAIPDLMAKRIINEQITPAFKAGDFAGGLNAAVDAVAARIRGEGLPQPSSTPTPTSTRSGVDVSLHRRAHRRCGAHQPLGPQTRIPGHWRWVRRLGLAGHLQRLDGRLDRCGGLGHGGSARRGCDTPWFGPTRWWPRHLDRRWARRWLGVQ
jgi:hypothetical protein